MSQPLLLSVSEASERLGVGQDEIRALIRSRKLGSVPIGKGRNRKIPVVALEEYVRNAMEGGTR